MTMLAYCFEQDIVVLDRKLEPLWRLTVVPGLMLVVLARDEKILK